MEHRLSECVLVVTAGAGCFWRCFLAHKEADMETFLAIKEKLDPFLSRPLVESFEAIEKAAGGELQ